ncbi:PrsW family intramembrane metalloprotease [Brachybacterium hainanense]|uniref:PrsW family intramembrane metalloprotease n=1 Tax=Brachybacterium hainanense TaxID=1541174 RepID=A0ABV6RAW1_9MICO
MSLPPGPPPQQGQPRPRPGAAPHPQGAPGFQSTPQYVDYGLPRLYDTSVRPAGGLTAARFAPAPLHAPQQAQPQSAWATQTRQVQQLSRSAPSYVPVSQVLIWVVAALLGMALLVVLAYFFIEYALTTTSNPLWWLGYAILASGSLLVIAGVILLADRWDPQPIGLLLSAVLWGAAIAVGISYVVNTAVSLLAYVISGSEGFASVVGAVVSAPITEETSKGLGLVLLFLIARRYFNGPLDGLLYGALIGGGFAFTENILYYGNALDSGGVTGLVVNGFIRGVIGIFGHAVYTSLTGVIMGLVARKWGTLPGVLVFLVATWPGIALHALWNGSSFLFPSFAGLVVMLLVEMALSFVWLVLIGVLVWDEARLTRVRLGDYANRGWLTHEEVTMLATWSGRREGRRWARQIGALPVMKKFIRDSADLASVRQRLMADGANPKAVEHERQLLGKLTANRAQLLGASGGA